MKKVLLTVLIVAMVMISTSSITPRPAHAGVWCEIAQAYGGRSVQYNFLCFVEVIMDVFNDDYWGDL